LVQVTETGDVVLATRAAKVSNARAFAEAWQEACTVAETLKLTLAVAAEAGRNVVPDARMAKASRSNTGLIDTAVSP
jgi:adenosyl cobinamide kinase/adenosyl cobinamide phosphate guanylyltransferase